MKTLPHSLISLSHIEQAFIFLSHELRILFRQKWDFRIELL